MAELRRMAYLSVTAALVTMGLKFLAYWLTDSVSLFSDAAESSVNLLRRCRRLLLLPSSL